MTRVPNLSCLYRLSPSYTAHQPSIGQFLDRPITNKILMSVCSGNIFGLSQKERVNFRSSSVRKLSFPALVASRFYFRLNYSGRHLRLHFSLGKLFAQHAEPILHKRFRYFHFPQTFLFSVKL